MTLIEQHAAAVWHADALDVAQRARLVRALRSSRRAGRLAVRSELALQRATATRTFPH